MTDGSAEDKTSPDNKDGVDTGAERQPVAKTMLDINLGDLIDPLSSESVNKNPISPDTSGDSKVSKTLLETDGPTLERIKELSESGRHLSKTRLESDLALPKQGAEPEDDAVHIKKLAKTIPEPATRNKSVDAETLNLPVADLKDKNSLKELARTIPEAETRQTDDADSEGDSASLKQLAKTIPDPQMLERKAVAARIARIRAFQKTVEVKTKKFSKTFAESNFEGLSALDSLRESGQWGSPSTGRQVEKAPVREQFVVARTRLDHNILFQAVSDSKMKEEARVAAFLIEKSKEAPKAPPVPVKAERTSSPCPFKWEETDSTEKYRYCTQCQTPVYNFDGMERPEAEALIFNRENLDKFTLYSRADGKFTTVDCPLQKKRRRDLVMGIIAAVALIIGAVAILIFIPRTQPAEDNGSANTSSESSSPSSNNPDSSGMVTFSSDSNQKPVAKKKGLSGVSTSSGGTGYQPFQLPAANEQSSKAPDPDEDGHFWKFDQ